MLSEVSATIVLGSTGCHFTASSWCAAFTASDSRQENTGSAYLGLNVWGTWVGPSVRFAFLQYLLYTLGAGYHMWSLYTSTLCPVWKCFINSWNHLRMKYLFFCAIKNVPNLFLLVCAADRQLQDKSCCEFNELLRKTVWAAVLSFHLN